MKKHLAKAEVVPLPCVADGRIRNDCALAAAGDDEAAVVSPDLAQLKGCGPKPQETRYEHSQREECEKVRGCECRDKGGAEKGQPRDREAKAKQLG